jgi:hypothetical protein
MSLGFTLSLIGLVLSIVAIFMLSTSRIRFRRPKLRSKLVRPDHVRELTHDELDHIAMKGDCPYCRGDLYMGPEGGMCVNLLCKTEGCWSRFNYCRLFGQYMGQDKRGF